LAQPLLFNPGGVRLISVRDIQRYLRSRRQRASDDGVSEEGYGLRVLITQ